MAPPARSVRWVGESEPQKDLVNPFRQRVAGFLGSITGRLAEMVGVRIFVHYRDAGRLVPPYWFVPFS